MAKSVAPDQPLHSAASDLGQQVFFFVWFFSGFSVQILWINTIELTSSMLRNHFEIFSNVLALVISYTSIIPMAPL